MGRPLLIWLVGSFFAPTHVACYATSNPTPTGERITFALQTHASNVAEPCTGECLLSATKCCHETAGAFGGEEHKCVVSGSGTTCNCEGRTTACSVEEFGDNLPLCQESCLETARACCSKYEGAYGESGLGPCTINFASMQAQFDRSLARVAVPSTCTCEEDIKPCRIYRANFYAKTYTAIIDLDVASSETIANVKTKIEDTYKVPHDEQYLTFNGKSLADDMTLSDYGIPIGSTISLLCLRYIQGSSYDYRCP